MYRHFQYSVCSNPHNPKKEILFYVHFTAKKTEAQKLNFLQGRSGRAVIQT